MPDEPHDAPLRELPAALWRTLRADPLHAPEHVALAAAQRHGPAARDWVAARRSRHDVSGRELAKLAKARHATLARLSGAATGVGGFATVVPDLALAAWIQSRLIFFIAAAYGYDPLDPVRPAEQLVLQGLYDDVGAARVALDLARGRPLALALATRRLSSGEQQTLMRRLARMVGKRAVRRFGGRLVPGLAIVANAVGDERDTRALADRAIRFYGG